MLCFIAASLLVFGADALLFPLSNGKDPEPELLVACPIPDPVAYGSGSCEYGMFEMTCTLNCDAGYVASIGGKQSLTATCDIFSGWSISEAPKCVVPGGTVVNPTGNPVSPNGCVSTLEDCLNRAPGDYQYCGDCRRFATCAGSGFYVRSCPGLSFFDSSIDQCADHSDTCV